MSTNYWEERHSSNNRPWDLNGVTPILRYFVESSEEGGELLKNLKRACVPGCGQKYDSEYLASKFKEMLVIGIDISPTSVKTCTESVDESLENVKFIEADFFKDDCGSFDFVFDHTFFCAIEPEIRKDWGNRMKSITEKYLLTLIYPVSSELNRDGPPFNVSFEAYEQVLKDGFDCIKRWPTESLPASNLKRNGREELALWKRREK